MSKLIIPFATLSMVLGGIAYFVSNNLYLSLGIGVLFLLIFVLFVAPSVAKFMKTKQKRHECYIFINAFLITLSVCQSLEKSFELATQSAEKEFKSTLDSIALLEAGEKIEYLSNYFEMPIYDMFLSVLRIYLEQGGDILKLSKTLMEELTRIEETSMSLSKNAIAVLLQWIVLWALSLAILAFVRFGLTSFYSTLSQSMTYLLMIIIYFSFLAISILIFTSKYTGEKFTFGKKKKTVKGVETYESA